MSGRGPKDRRKNGCMQVDNNEEDRRGKRREETDIKRIRGEGQGEEEKDKERRRRTPHGGRTEDR